MRQRFGLRAAKLLASLCVSAALVGLALLLGIPSAWPQIITGRENPLGSLKTIPTPEPRNLNQFLRTDAGGQITPRAREAAIALGKALFWDQAVGSDGQACASCHYNAGADSRTVGQVDPGLRAVPPDANFSAPLGAGYKLKGSDFPLTKFVDPEDIFSGIASDTNDVVSSQGNYNSLFEDVLPLQPCPADQGPIGDICDKVSPDPIGNGAIFNVAGNPVRNVEPRNTPTVINAVFYHRNFWDGRARNEFNGVNPIGDLDPYARVLVFTGASLQKVTLTGGLRLEDASLMSQAVGPPLSDMEMSAANRSFAKLGKKMLALPYALPGQLVHPEDSVLGNSSQLLLSSRYPDPGINKSYRELIQDAFNPIWWFSSQIIKFHATQPDSDGTVKLVYLAPGSAQGTTDEFTQMEFNFSLFWGIAIQMYEATLRADDSPMDQAFDSGDPLTFTSPKWGDLEKQGLAVFNGRGLCANCHGGPETTNASVRFVRRMTLERMQMADLGLAIYDKGIYNTAVRRCKGDGYVIYDGQCDDAGFGATIGPLNLPLSMTRFFQLALQGDPRIAIVCRNTPEACIVPPITGIPPTFMDPNERVDVDGAFKTSGLRNIELQAPYFHNGGDLTLMDMVQFYDRGGNFSLDNLVNLAPDLLDFKQGFPPRTIGLSEFEKEALVAFMKALTDERVRYQRAPFDHPQLFVPNLGGENDPVTGDPLPTPLELPMVGRAGSLLPLKTFQEKLAGETLSVVGAGTGSGTVSPVAMGSSASFSFGTPVTLTATPAMGSTFTGWSGGGCTGAGTCTVTMTAPMIVTATFTLQQFALSVLAAGTGSGTVSPVTTGTSALIDFGGVVTLTATPAAGSTFTGWSGGGCTGTAPCTLTVTAAQSVTATFETIPVEQWVKAALVTPTPGSPLTGASATFSWSAGTGATEYLLWVGTTAGRNNLYSKSQGLNRSATVKNLPTNGSPVFVRLFTRFTAGLQFADYTFTAGSFSQAALVTPTPGSPLTGASATFSWSAGTGATEYLLWVGTTAGHNQLYSKSLGLNRSATVNKLPTDGSAIFVRLFTRSETALQFTDYTFTAATISQAALVTPTPGSPLTGPTATFTWSNASGATEYLLWVGTTAGHNQLYSKSLGLNQSATVRNLPSGVPIFVRLLTRSETGLLFTDYTFTAAP